MRLVEGTYLGDLMLILLALFGCEPDETNTDHDTGYEQASQIAGFWIEDARPPQASITFVTDEWHTATAAGEYAVHGDDLIISQWRPVQADLVWSYALEEDRLRVDKTWYVRGFGE